MDVQGDGLVRITDESIERIPIIESSVLPEEHWETLREEQRELLRFVRDEEPGTEAIAYYTMDMKRLTMYKGSPGGGTVPSKRYSIPHVVIHSHPDGQTFSLDDIRPFIQNENTMFMSAVGNDGSLYTLEKTPRFIASEVAHRYLDALRSIPNPRIDLDGHIQFVENFYKSIQRYGFVYRKG